MHKYKSRKDVPEKYKWDLTDFYKNDKEFEDCFKKCSKIIKSLNSYKGCTKDAKKVKEFLDKFYEAYDMVENLEGYAYLISDQELGVSKNMERLSKSADLFNQFVVNSNFFDSELLTLNKKEYEDLFKYKELDKYKNLLDKTYRSKEHILDEKSETIIAELNNAMNHFEEMSSTMLNKEHDYGTVEIDGVVETISSTNYHKLMENKDRNIRKEVREKYSKTLDRYSNSSAQFLNGYVKANITDAKLHNFKNAWDAKLFNLNMPNKAYDALINTTEENVKSYQKYLRIFKDTLGLDKLYQYDLQLDMAKSDKEYSIEEAQELCMKAVEPLGKEYCKAFKKIIDNRYVDYAQYPGKCSGGYSLSTLSKDSRILMSFNSNLSSVSTLIHEGGHNVHHQFVKANNDMPYVNVSSLVSEVASLTNECLLSHYLANNSTSKEEKLAGINNIIEVVISNLFGAVREGKLEQDFYNYVDSGNAITKDYMDKITLDSIKKYSGKEVEYDEYSGLSWARRSHYYMNYYLFNYAFCISVALFVASRIINGDKDMLDKYIKFLGTGSNVWPIDAFRILDVDLEDKKVYEEAIKYFDSLLDQFVKISKEGEK